MQMLGLGVLILLGISVPGRAPAFASRAPATQIRHDLLAYGFAGSCGGTGRPACIIELAHERGNGWQHRE